MAYVHCLLLTILNDLTFHPYWNIDSPIATFKPNYMMKSGSSNLPDGVVHIFREKLRNKNSDESSTQTSASTSSNTKSQSHTDNTDTIPGPSTFSFGKDATAVAVLAVPERMAPADFLAFVAPTAENMKHLRFIRDAHPSRTMAVIQFRTAESATEFFEEFNGVPYNALEVRIQPCFRLICFVHQTHC